MYFDPTRVRRSTHRATPSNPLAALLLPGVPWPFTGALPGPTATHCTCRVPGAVLAVLCPAPVLGSLPPRVCGHCCVYCAEACRA